MTDLRTAAQQALAFTMRDFASLRDFEAAKAVLHDNLRAALAQQAEPVESVARECSDPMCACRGGPCAECEEGEREKEIEDLRSSLYFYQRRCEALQSWQSKMRDPERTIVCDILANGKTLDPAVAGNRYTTPQQAEPVAGKVVAWGVFANIDGEWQLQHPVFAGDEQGKVNAEFERASYSGPQPLEVRPLGVVTATAQQAEPAQEPVAWEDWWRNHGQYNFRATAGMTFERAKELMKLAFEVGREAAPPQQAEPVEPVAWKQGNLVTFNEDPYPALGGLFVQFWDGEEVAARVYANDLKTLRQRCAKVYTAPPQRKPLTEEVAALIAQRDALLEALKAAEPYLRHADVDYNVYVQCRAAIKAVEEGK